MRRAGPVVLALSLFLYLALVPQACSDQTSSTVAPDMDVSAAKGGNGKATLPEGAASEAKINKLIQALFPQPEKQQAHQLFAQIKSALDDGDTEAARDLMFELLDLLLTTDLNEPSDITKAEAKTQFTDLLFEFVGLQAPDVDPALIQDIEDGTVDGVVAVIEGDKDNTIITPGTENPDGETGNTGLFVPDGALPDDEDYLLVVRELPVPCANTVFEQLPFCYEYETFPSPAVFNPGTEGIVAVCVDLDLPQEFASLIQDSDGVVAELPERDPSAVVGFTCEPRNITDAGSSNPIVRLARAVFRPVTHLFDPPYLVAINTEGMAGSIGSIDTRYVGTVPKVIAKVSGDGQTGAPGSTLPDPFVVKVVHAHDGTPAVGVPVTFSVTGGGGSLSASLDSTNANGEASTTLTLGSATGTNTVEASAPQTNLTGDPSDPAGAVTFTAEATTLLVQCLLGGGGDQIAGAANRGFYHPSFPGTSLDQVNLWFSSDVAGAHTIELTVRENAYNGPILGTAQATVNLSNDRNAFVGAAFQTGIGTVTQGSTVTFEMQVIQGPGTPVFFEVPDPDNPNCPVVETNGTSPPLDSFRRQGVKVEMFGASGTVGQ